MGASRPVTNSVRFFAALGASLDVVKTNMAGSSTGTLFGVPAPFSSIASDRDSTVSGRGQLRSGFLYAVPDLPITAGISGTLQYIGAVPRVVFPQSSVTAFNGAGFQGPSQAQIENEGQFNFGGAFNATWRF